ncbi:hypothetical protein ACFS07_07820 [Undibacterium arcticum]
MKKTDRRLRRRCLCRGVGFRTNAGIGADRAAIGTSSSASADRAAVGAGCCQRTSGRADG